TMKLIQILTLCLALSLNEPEPEGHKHELHHGVKLDRCEGMEFDAVAVNEEGIPYFFKDNPDHHDHQFFFLHKLEKDYPKDISEIFLGIPDHLDAAVECPKPDCTDDTVIFFKGGEIYHFNMKTKKVDEKEFKSMPNCTGAFRYMDHYYCFHGHQFSKFDPVTGEVHGKYPKETRDYFMRCPHFGKEQCSRVHLDAITSDDNGSVYAFRGEFSSRQHNKSQPYIQGQKLSCPFLKYVYQYLFIYLFSHLLDAFIQSDLQMRTTGAINCSIKTTKNRSKTKS
uniref:Hemopexin a n=1 Tax=Sinocyclocheilus anshuiensis TaxID=1608454 RepID=A0A671NEX5_9TELE